MHEEKKISIWDDNLIGKLLELKSEGYNTYHCENGMITLTKGDERNETTAT